MLAVDELEFDSELPSSQGKERSIFSYSSLILPEFKIKEIY
jgi:hypothetical protein